MRGKEAMAADGITQLIPFDEPFTNGGLASVTPSIGNRLLQKTAVAEKNISRASPARS